MARLLQAMAGARYGGAEAFFERLALGFRRAGVAQRVVIRGGERATRLRAAGIDVIELPFGGSFDFRTRPGLGRAINEFGPQVVLSWMSRAASFCPRGDFIHAGRLGGYYNLKYYRRCDHLIGNTRGIVDYIRAAGWPAERVHYLPNFVTMGAVAPLARARLATPDEAPVALGLGRLHRNKGFDVLIAAIAHLPRFHLWLAGEGPERRALEAQSRRLGIRERVHFLGWREDVAALFAAADLFVCASRVEPLGNSVLEAWAAGKPVVATASDGPRELLRDGATGLLVPVADADALARAMTRLMADGDLRHALGAAGLAAHEAEFAEPRVIALYLQFLDRVTRRCAALPAS